MVGRIVGLLLVFAIPSVEKDIGILRIGFVLLPVELLGVAYWWGKHRQDRLLIPLLGIMAVIYH